MLILALGPATALAEPPKAAAELTAVEHALLGDQAFRRDALAEAMSHYEQAAQLDPNDVTVRDRIAVLTAYREADARFDQLFIAHGLVKYRPQDRRLAVAAAEYLSALSESVAGVLQYRFERPITVMLHSKETFGRLTGSPPWARGLFDGKIHLAVDTLSESPQALRDALAHEYAHAALHRLSGGRLPTWLNEGLASELAGGPEPAAPPHAAGRESVSAAEWDRMAPLHALHDSFLGFEPRDAAAAYAESRGAAHLLVARHGWQKVRDLLEALRDGSEFGAAFERVLGEPYRDFERQWAATRKAGTS